MREVSTGRDGLPPTDCICKLTNWVSVCVSFHWDITSVVIFAERYDIHKEHVATIRRTEIGNGHLRIIIDDPAVVQLRCILCTFFNIQIPDPLQITSNKYVVILIQTVAHAHPTCDYIIARQRCKHGRCQTEAKRQCQGQCEYSFYLFHSLVSFLLQFY